MPYTLGKSFSAPDYYTGGNPLQTYFTGKVLRRQASVVGDTAVGTAREMTGAPGIYADSYAKAGPTNPFSSAASVAPAPPRVPAGAATVSSMQRGPAGKPSFQKGGEGAFEPLTPGTVLDADDQIAVPRGGQVDLQLGDGTRISLTGPPDGPASGPRVSLRALADYAKSTGSGTVNILEARAFALR